MHLTMAIMDEVEVEVRVVVRDMAGAVEDEEEVVAEAEVAMGEEVGQIFVTRKGSASRGRTVRAPISTQI